MMAGEHMLMSESVPVDLIFLAVFFPSFSLFCFPVSP